MVVERKLTQKEKDEKQKKYLREYYHNNKEKAKIYLARPDVRARRNEYYKEYRKKYRERMRKYHREYMRERRARIKAEEEN